MISSQDLDIDDFRVVGLQKAVSDTRKLYENEKKLHNTTKQDKLKLEQNFKDLEDAKDEAERTERILKDDILALKRKLLQVENNLKVAQAKTEKAQSDIESFRKKYHDEQLKCVKQVTALEYTNKYLDNEKAEHDRTRKILSKEENSHSKTTENLKNTIFQLETSNGRLATMEREKREVEQLSYQHENALNAKTLDLEEIKKRLSAKKEQITIMGNNLKTSESSNKEWRQKFEDKKKQFETTEHKMKDLDAKFSSQTSKLRKARERFKTAGNVLQSIYKKLGGSCIVFRKRDNRYELVKLPMQEVQKILLYKSSKNDPVIIQPTA